MEAFEPGKRLQRDQLPPFIQLLQRLDAIKYETLALRQQAAELAAIMQLACPDDTALWAMTAELNEWVRWYRAPGYCLTYIFQLVTMKADSSAHIAAALLFADAQIGMAEDEAMLSLEVAWETLNKISEAYPDSADDLERVRRDLISRLRLMHHYYASYSRPLDYLTVHPVFYSLNSERIWSDLRVTCPKETEAVESAGAAADKSAAFERLIAELESRGDTYHWLTARRVAAVDRDSQGQVSEAEVDISGCLRDARQFGLEAEIGHLLRIHAWQLTALGQFDAAAAELEAALKHEQPLSLFSYWYALTARELGVVRMQKALLTQEGLSDEKRRSELLGSALQAYAPSRRLFDVVTNSSGPPAGAISKRQMFRRYTGNALQAALGQSSPVDALAEIEATGPRGLTTAMAETTALAQLPGAPDEFLASRALFQRYLTSIPLSFDAYLANLPAEYPLRRRYHDGLDQVRVLPGGKSDDIANRLLARRGDDRLVLAFFIDSLPLSCAVLLDLADGSLRHENLAVSDQDLRAAHEEYLRALDEAAGVPGYPPIEARAALDAFLAAIQAMLQPALTMLAERAHGRRVVIVPQLELHDVPFAALRLGDDLLLDVVSSVSALPSLGVLADLLDLADRESDGPPGLTALHDTKGTPFFAGTMRELAARGPVSVITDPDPAATLSQLRDLDSRDVLFACHGKFDIDNPADSSLQLGPGGGLSLSDIWSGLALSKARCVVLGACESGMTRAQIGSEYAGFAGAFFSAGARAVIGSLWEVNQLATAVLLADCLSRIGAGEDVPGALSAAQRALRQTTRDALVQWIADYLPELRSTLTDAIGQMPAYPFAHPDDWAGFFTAGC
jgi:CHAT domain-containing protein